MIACLRSSRFLKFEGGKAQVYLDLRRLQDIDAIAWGRYTRQFVVTRREPPQNRLTGIGIIQNKWFDSLDGEMGARAYWRDEAMKLIDSGYQKIDFTIMGFHEED